MNCTVALSVSCNHFVPCFPLRHNNISDVICIISISAFLYVHSTNLALQVLRHEEFEEGCAATCNGPYNGKWSKTMVGYGPEANHFVVELTYNYEGSKILM